MDDELLNRIFKKNDLENISEAEQDLYSKIFDTIREDNLLESERNRLENNLREETIPPGQSNNFINSTKTFLSYFATNGVSFILQILSLGIIVFLINSASNKINALESRLETIENKLQETESEKIEPSETSASQVPLVDTILSNIERKLQEMEDFLTSNQLNSSILDSTRVLRKDLIDFRIRMRENQGTTQKELFSLSKNQDSILTYLQSLNLESNENAKIDSLLSDISDLKKDYVRLTKPWFWDTSSFFLKDSIDFEQENSVIMKAAEEVEIADLNLKLLEYHKLDQYNISFVEIEADQNAGNKKKNSAPITFLLQEGEAKPFILGKEKIGYEIYIDKIYAPIDLSQSKNFSVKMTLRKYGKMKAKK